jgi:hypothetical protein
MLDRSRVSPDCGPIPSNVQPVIPNPGTYGPRRSHVERSTTACRDWLHSLDPGARPCGVIAGEMINQRATRATGGRGFIGAVVVE